MKWTAEAEAEIRKVPFFVRKKVRQQVENEAAAAGKALIGLAEVNATRQNYLTGMSREIKGYQLDVCFGPGGCPNRAGDAGQLMQRIEAVLRDADLLSFLKQQVKGDLKFHHEFRVTLAECPNACSQPQLADYAIVGVRKTTTSQEARYDLLHRDGEGFGQALRSGLSEAELLKVLRGIG